MPDTEYWACPVLAGQGALPANIPKACLTAKKQSFSRLLGHLKRCHASDCPGSNKTDKGLINVFTHQQIQVLWEELKKTDYQDDVERWYGIVSAVQDITQGTSFVDRSRIQGPYNPDDVVISDQVQRAPAEQLNQISFRDHQTMYEELNPGQQMIVCRTWMQQGQKYIEPTPAAAPMSQPHTTQSGMSSGSIPSSIEVEDAAVAALQLPPNQPDMDFGDIQPSMWMGDVPPINWNMQEMGDLSSNDWNMEEMELDGSNTFKESSAPDETNFFDKLNLFDG